MIPLFKAAVSPHAHGLVRSVLDSGLLEHGPKVREFETTVGRQLGNPRTLAVNCATSGLHLALSLVARPVEPGHSLPGAEQGEVLTTPLTFEGTNWPILANGLRLRWVDVDPATLTMDLDDLAAKITPATRAIVVVHWGGYPVDLNRLRAVVDEAEASHGVRPMVIEDCAHAWGATYRGQLLGNHGHVNVFSFGAIKLLTCGSGGLVVFPDAELLRHARRRSWFGIDRQADRLHGDYDVADWGYRFLMNDIAAATGLANLEIVEHLLARHRENAGYYDKELSQVPGLELTERADDREPTFWLYPVKVEGRAGFMRKMAGAGITTSVVSRRNDTHSCVAAASTPLPGLDRLHDHVVYLPVGWWLSEEDRALIASTVTSGW